MLARATTTKAVSRLLSHKTSQDWTYEEVNDAIRDCKKLWALAVENLTNLYKISCAEYKREYGVPHLMQVLDPDVPSRSPNGKMTAARCRRIGGALVSMGLDPDLLV
jgi:hypothetical protein